MADETGNVLKVPGFTKKAATEDPEILASYAGLTQKGLTMLMTASTTWKAGTVIKVSGTPKKYTGAAKADAPAPGTFPTGGQPLSGVVGILRKNVDVSTEDKLANVVLSGRVKGEMVKYSDDTNGLSAAELQALAVALGGHYIAYNDMLVF